MLDPEKRRFLICLQKKSTKQIFGKTLSLKEYMDEEPGICVTIDIECPLKQSCQAYTASRNK